MNQVYDDGRYLDESMRVLLIGQSLRNPLLWVLLFQYYDLLRTLFLDLLKDACFYIWNWELSRSSKIILIYENHQFNIFDSYSILREGLNWKIERKYLLLMIGSDWKLKILYRWAIRLDSLLMILKYHSLLHFLFFLFFKRNPRYYLSLKY
jgi:hypothetical protein